MNFQNNVFLRAAVLTTIIFALGVWFGLWVGDEKVSQLQTTISGLQENINEAELQFLFLDITESNISCNYLISTANRLGEETTSMASEVDKYENAQKVDDAAFKALKKTYTITLIRDWLTLEKIKQSCNGSYTIVLYFYSNKQCDKCQDQGIVLSYLKEKLGNELLTFALDGDIDLDIIKALRESYVIYEYPAVVVNGKTYHGYQDLANLTEIICGFNHDLEIC
jgi:hypothetical protein